MAWWHATPKAPNAKVSSRKKEQSRLQSLLDEGGEPLLPEVRLPHLIEFFFRVGPTLPGGMGPAPLSHLELRAWQENVGVELTPWEVEALWRLSREYIAEYQDAESPDRPPPWAGRQVDREMVARKVDALLG